jgi:two-component system, NtrC family, response regulator AtoC
MAEGPSAGERSFHAAPGHATTLPSRREFARMKMNILIVEDERIIVDIIRRGLQPHGFQVLSASCAKEATDIFKSEPVDLVILDYSLPDICGAALFSQLRAVRPDLPVVFLTGHANLQTAVELMRNGVNDYLTKPFNVEELASRIKAILQTARRAQGNPAPDLKPANSGWFPGGYIFGESEAMRGVDAQIRNLPRYPDTTVLITGPTGTGKSVVARRIHELSRDRNAPFVEIDCSTIPRELCESELFGHEKGSFTGAHRTKLGLFEAAAGGTAFLDEIGELDLALQAKLLHVLEAHEFKRVGGQTTLPMSARVIAATNRSLPDLVSTGRFREDLYFRLNVFEL